MPIRLLLLLTSTCLLLAGCATLGYYNQAAQGHFALLAAARPIADWVQDPATPQPLKQRLLRAKEIRRYAAEALRNAFRQRSLARTGRSNNQHSRHRKSPS